MAFVEAVAGLFRGMVGVEDAMGAARAARIAGRTAEAARSAETAASAAAAGGRSAAAAADDMGQAARSASLADKAVGAAKSVGGTVLDAGIMFGTFAGLDKVFGGGRKTMADPDETGGAREIHNGLPHPGEGSGGGGIASGGWPGVVLLFLVLIVLLAWIF